MLNKLYNENIEPRCVYCSYGKIMGKDEIACVRRGIMSSSGHCRGFRYEPTKREPRETQGFVALKFSQKDFSIED